MSEEARRRGLGRGLSALLGEDDEAPAAEATAAGSVRHIAIELVHPGRFQPRRHFDEESLQSLVQSIVAQGILQPLLVRRHPEIEGGFEILAGERRWRAAQRAQLHEVPVLVRDIADRAALEIALVENVQRQDLTALEEAEGYQRLIAEFAYTQERLAQSLGKSRSHIANTLRLLNLPAEVRQALEEGTISAGHARALLGSDDPLPLLQEVVRLGCNVRQTEERVQRQQKGEPAPRPGKPRDANVQALERELAEALGLRVRLAYDGEGGSLAFFFRGADQLDELLSRLRRRDSKSI